MQWEWALPHADSSKGVIKEAASFVRLKKGIEFGSEFNDPGKICNRNEY